MPSMYLALGYVCNHHCFFCPCGEKSELPAFADADQLIQAIDAGIQNQGVDHIILSGGEPTLHPSFYSILQYCVDQGLEVSLLTNGDSLADMERASVLFASIDPRAVNVTTALHSDLPEFHERVTASAGSFQRCVQGLLNLMQLGIPVTVKQVISRWNYHRLPDFVDFLYRTYGPGVSLTLCGMDFCGMKSEQIADVAVNFQEIQPSLELALDQVISLRQQYGAFPQVSVADLPLCCTDPYYWGFFTKVSRNSLSQYSAPEGKHGEVSLRTQVGNDCDVYFEGCKECCMSEVCPGVWYTAWQHFGEDAVHPIHPYMESFDKEL